MLDLAPELDRARSVKGAILLQQGRLADAAAVFRQEALEDPASATLLTRNHALLCAAESRAGDKEGAAQRIENLLRNAPEAESVPVLARDRLQRGRRSRFCVLVSRQINGGP